MAEIKKNLFLKGKLQKDLDERLVPDGEYRDATNMRIVTSLSSNVGSATNVLGNENLTNLSIPSSATCIGSTTDETTGRIFFLVTTPSYRDYVLEYNAVDGVVTTLLEETKGRTLKFDTNYRITGFNFIRGNALIGDQLSWTDNLNPPRKFYIETVRAQTASLGVNWFDEDDISLIKRPPFTGPVVDLVRDYTITSNYIEGEYFLFAYRYIYEGEEVSTTSFFSQSLVTDYLLDSEGSIEFADPNIINITVNTGDSRVKKIEVLFNQPQSNNYFLIQSIDKESEGIGDSINYTIRFDNNQTYQILPDSDTLKIYDNVPQLAKDQNYVANRLMFLNYTEGYDSIPLNYSASPLYLSGYQNSSVEGTLGPSVATVNFVISPWETIKNSRIQVFTTVILAGKEYEVFGSYYVKSENLNTLSDFMATSYQTGSEAQQFIAFIVDIFQNNVYLKTATGRVPSDVSFTATVTTINSTQLSITLPAAGLFTTPSNQLSVTNTPTTFLSNNSQEFGIVYYDNYNRSGSVQYLDSGKVFYSDLRTRVDNGQDQRGAVEITIRHDPPSWATKYKIVRKDNGYVFNKFFILPSIYKWSEENSYYLPLTNNQDKNKVVLDENIFLTTNPTIIFKAQEIVSNLPEDGQSDGIVSDDFGFIKATLVSGDLGSGVPVTPDPSEGTLEAFEGGQFNSTDKNQSTENFYECSNTFSIAGGFHRGNEQNQSLSLPAIVQITEGDSYMWGRDVFTGINYERFKYQDNLTGNKYESVNKIRANIISTFVFRRERIASISYSDIFNVETSFNGLNSFNLSQANFKDLTEREGSIQKSFDREGDLVVLQEHQISKVLINRDAYFNAEGNVNITAADAVIGEQLHYLGEYGISLDPDSFAFWGNSLYWTDKNRGTVMELNGAGQFEISRDGMRGFFKREFDLDTGALRIGGYDPVHDEYVLSFGVGTLAYSAISQTWTQFYSFTPDQMVNVQGKFYSIKGIDVYLHNSSNVPRNTFYGVTSPSKMSFVANPFPSTVKILQNLKIQGNKAWNANIRVYKSDSEDYFETTLSSTDFNLREGMWYSELKRSEVDSTSSKATYGLGTVISKQGNNITINGGNCSLTVGDDLYKSNPVTLVGEVLSVNGNVLTLSDATNVSVNDFVYGQKNMRIEGNEMRGYTARIDLELDDTEKIELYGVDSFGIQSSP
jgi:hypothetical protein